VTEHQICRLGTSSEILCPIWISSDRLARRFGLTARAGSFTRSHPRPTPPPSAARNRRVTVNIREHSVGSRRPLSYKNGRLLRRFNAFKTSRPLPPLVEFIAFIR